MKIISIHDQIPHTQHGGGGITAYSAIEGFLKAGNSVAVLVLKGRKQDNLNHQSALETLGTTVHFMELPEEKNLNIFYKVFKTFYPSFENLFPNIKHVKAVHTIIDQFSPDTLFVYHWEALASIYGIKGYLKIATVGDPIHLPSLFRRSLYSRLDHEMTYTKKLLYLFLDKFAVKRQLSGMVRLLNDCEINGAFAAHHAKELESIGVKKCHYFHTPVPDVDRSQYCPKEKFKIVLMGVLIGVASLSGIELFIKEIYPQLCQELGENNFEVHVVGGYFETMPQYLQNSMTRHNIIIRGQVNPADCEFINGDVLLVPTPIDLGIRVRIITAFSFGSLVVAHSANQKGIPELIHEYNGLIGSTGKEIASQIIRVYNQEVNIDLIKTNSRKTYEEQFTSKFFADQIEKAVRELS